MTITTTDTRTHFSACPSLVEVREVKVKRMVGRRLYEETVIAPAVCQCNVIATVLSEVLNPDTRSGVLKNAVLTAESGTFTKSITTKDAERLAALAKDALNK